MLIGVGTVGEAIARLSAERDWCEAMVLADYDEGRARTLSDALGGAPRFPSAQIDARDPAAVTALARASKADLVMNAVDPQFVMPIFTGALEADANYIDMAMSLSHPHPDRPFEIPGVKLGDEQFAMAAEWEARGRWRWSAWEWTPAWPTSLPPTPPSTTSTRCTRCMSATAATSRFPATPSPRCSASGPPSRSASTRRSSGTPVRGARPSRSRRRRPFRSRRGSAGSSA